MIKEEQMRAAESIAKNSEAIGQLMDDLREMGISDEAYGEIASTVRNAESLHEFGGAEAQWPTERGLYFVRGIGVGGRFVEGVAVFAEGRLKLIVDGQMKPLGEPAGVVSPAFPHRLDVCVPMVAVPARLVAELLDRARAASEMEPDTTGSAAANCAVTRQASLVGDWLSRNGMAGGLDG